MEIEQRDQSFVVDNSSPATKRRKLDNNNEQSSPQKPMENTIADCPIMSLPIDLLSKIIARVPIAQRHVLELVDKNFREATLHAWRQLRHADLGEFLIVSKTMDDESTLERDIRTVTSIIEKLTDRSPFLTSLHGVSLQTEILDLNFSIIACVARFEHLESISFGDGSRRHADLGCPIQVLNFFLETTRSRSTLKELINKYCTIDSSHERQPTLDTFVRRFSQLVSDDRGFRDSMKMEKLSILNHYCWDINFDRMDLSRMVELRFGWSAIKPEQLASMINRAPHLERLNFAFFHCKNGDGDCGGNGLRKNTDLLKAISSREKLKSLEFYRGFYILANETYHEHCMRFELEFISMLKALGRRGIIEKLNLSHHDFVSPKFDMSRVIATISENCSRLRSFTLPIDDCNANDLKTIVKMEYLEELDLLFKGDLQKFSDITDGVFTQLGSHKRLKRVLLGGFAREDERPLDELAKLSTLEAVHIRRVNFVRKEEFVSWSEGQHVGNLESMTLSGIGVVDKDAEVGLISLLQKAPRLRSLQIEGFVTDRLLEAIAESCPKLACLGVASRNREISVAALQKIVDRCPKLKGLGGMKDDVRKQLTFPKYWKMSNVCANRWSTDGDDDDDVDYN